MSTVVYQGLQSSIEPHLIKPLGFKHNLAPSKPTFGGWSFDELFQTSLQTKPVKAYVHSVPKQSSTTLSKHSLDMCTESLGSETGNYTQSNHEISSYLSTREKDQSKPRGFAKKLTPIRSFPPPLSSSYKVQVKPHREDGRLVIRATRKTSPNDYFQTERKNGRLKLSLIKEECQGCDEEKHIEGACKFIQGIGGNSENVRGEIENMSNRCKGEGSGKSGISSWGPLLVASS